MKRIFSRMADVAAASLAGFAVCCPFVERLVLSALRPFRTRRAIEPVWRRLRADLVARLGGSPRGLRWACLPGGAYLRLNMADMPGSIYLERVPYEPLTTKFMLEETRPGDVCADIGANCGYFTMLLGSRVGADGRVYAFEPNPALCELIRESSARNGFGGRIETIQGALGDREAGSVDFYLSCDATNTGLSTLAPDARHIAAGALSENGKISVRLRRFDAWAGEVGLRRLDGIKIDVEGVEELVLVGMEESLKRFSPRWIVCETTIHGTVTTFFKRLGYRAEMLECHVPAARWGNVVYRR